MAEGIQTHHKAESDRLDSISWAFILIWGGIVFLANNAGLINGFNNLLETLPFNIDRIGPWTLIFLGAGVIVLIEAIIRLISPLYSSASVSGNLIGAGVLFGLGLGNLVGWGVVWPLILIAVGVGIFLTAILNRG